MINRRRNSKKMIQQGSVFRHAGLFWRKALNLRPDIYFTKGEGGGLTGLRPSRLIALRFARRENLMSVAVTVKAMVAAGCTAQQIADVVAIMEARRDADKEARHVQRSRREARLSQRERRLQQKEDRLNGTKATD